MTYRRPPKGTRMITVQLSTDLIAHLDQRAAERTISRAAMVRQLVIADRKAEQAT